MNVMISLLTCIVLLVLVAAAVGLAYRRGWILTATRFQRPGVFAAASVMPAGRVARFVEAAVLGMIGGVIVLTTAPRQRFMGCCAAELIRNAPAPGHTVWSMALFAVAMAAVGAAAFVVLCGRTRTGGILMGVALIGYGASVNTVRDPNQAFPPKASGEFVVKYTIDVAGANVKGADLWVNGVYLGKTPYTTTISEFESMVPYWSKLPARYEKEKVKWTCYEPDGHSAVAPDRWAEFHLSVCASSQEDARKLLKHSEHPGQDTWAKYYAKLAYAGEWGTSDGASGGGTEGYSNTRLRVAFRQREKRLGTLLNMARLSEYRVGPDWYRAAETYNGDAWTAMGKLAEQEPGMAKVRDAWATWRYALDRAVDGDSAWVAFARICDEAEKCQRYSTDSVTGRAVELLVPKLPHDRLVDRALPLARSTGPQSYAYSESDGRLQFECRPPEMEYYDLSWFVGIRTSSPTPAAFGAGDFPVAHALWLLNQRLQATDQSQPNLIQRRIVPEIVRWHHSDFLTMPMTLAASFGGPTIDKFLLRQPWGKSPDPAGYVDWTYVTARQVNKWLYYLAYLNDDAGRGFRRRQADLIMTMADTICENRLDFCFDDLRFVFMDPWLAKRYWPRFARLARHASGAENLKIQWEYLVRMGDAASVDMFVAAWKDTRLSSSDYWQAPNTLERLKPPMRGQVLAALVRQVRKDDGNLADVWNTVSGRTPAEKKESVISMLESRDAATAKLRKAETIFADLKKGRNAKNEDLWRNVPLWLEESQPDSPLTAMLANADKPDLRLMAVGALREYPIPERRALLDKLLKDSDSTVRAAAERASQRLKKLAAQKPADFASDAASATR
jgi:hypothetical protein